jgi:hypothetical protein
MNHELRKVFLLLVLASMSWGAARAQATFSGSVQSDMLIPQTDEKIGAEKKEDFQTNTYADLQLQSIPTFTKASPTASVLVSISKKLSIRTAAPANAAIMAAIL